MGSVFVGLARQDLRCTGQVHPVFPIRVGASPEGVAQSPVERQQVRCHACIGGTSVRDDIDRLRDGQHVVVGTPGRVYDMISKRRLVVDDLITFVLDEACTALIC